MAVLPTAIWRFRPSGVNTNGGGYDPGIAGAATDYSRQNAAQATGTNGATSGAGSTTFTDATAAAFTSAMVGNCIQIASGTNFQAGFYFVTGFTNANSVVLDRTPSSGGAGSAGVWALGGGWLDFVNTTAAKAALAPGNICYFLGSGTPNPSSYTYDFTISGAITLTPGTTSGFIDFVADPATPGYVAPPDASAGMPVIRCNAGACLNSTLGRFSGLYFVGTAGGATPITGGGGTNNPSLFGCVFDATTSFNPTMISGANNVIGCEAFSSTGTTGSTSYAITSTGIIVSCNIHDFQGGGITTTTSTVVKDCIIAKNQLDGIKNAFATNIFMNNTIDGNLGHGIEITTQASINTTVILNNIISNHVTAGKFGITCGAGTAFQNLGARIDYNVYYNNTTDLNAINYGAHDTHGGSNPYVGQSTGNYTLA